MTKKPMTNIPREKTKNRTLGENMLKESLKKVLIIYRVMLFYGGYLGKENTA